MRLMRLMSPCIAVVGLIVIVLVIMETRPRNTNAMIELFGGDERLFLVGDSTLNNSNYVAIENTVASITKKTHSKTILGAEDNAEISWVNEQLTTTSPTKHDTVCLSVGGNDLLNAYRGGDLTNESFLNNAKDSYEKLLNYIHKKYTKRVLLCDLYYPADPSFAKYQPIIKSWNAFLREMGGKYKCTIISISKVVTDANHFTDKIEPSESGSALISSAILKKRVVD